MMLYSGIAISQSNSILESQSVTYSGTDGKLLIHFYTPMGYVSHFPAKKGSKIKITLKELLPTAQRNRTFSERLRVEQLIDSKNSVNPPAAGNRAYPKGDRIPLGEAFAIIVCSSWLSQN